MLTYVQQVEEISLVRRSWSGRELSTKILPHLFDRKNGSEKSFPWPWNSSYILWFGCNLHSSK
jgi:hypothetical protein